MAAKKGGLGKGLDALFLDNAVEGEKADGAVSLRIHDIEPNKAQPRKTFDQRALSDLSESIAQHGIIQPLLVRPLPGGGYQLVAGERRWRAARMAGLSEVPVVIRELNDAETMELALIENLQREDLNPIEEAEGIQILMETYGLTQEHAAQRIGRSRSAVANSLRLLGLPEPVKELARVGKISAGHARALLAFQNEEALIHAANQIVKGEVSVRKLEQMAKETAASVNVAAPKTPKSRDSYYDEVELALSDVMGRKVTVHVEKGKGKLEIEFYSMDDLREIANTITEQNE